MSDVSEIASDFEIIEEEGEDCQSATTEECQEKRKEDLKECQEKREEDLNPSDETKEEKLIEQPQMINKETPIKVDEGTSTVVEEVKKEETHIQIKKEDLEAIVKRIEVLEATTRALSERIVIVETNLTIPVSQEAGSKGLVVGPDQARPESAASSSSDDWGEDLAPPQKHVTFNRAEMLRRATSQLADRRSSSGFGSSGFGSSGFGSSGFGSTGFGSGGYRSSGIEKSGFGSGGFGSGSFGNGGGSFGSAVFRRDVEDRRRQEENRHQERRQQESRQELSRSRDYRPFGYRGTGVSPFAIPRPDRWIAHPSYVNHRELSPCQFCCGTHSSDECPTIPNVEDRRRDLEKWGRCLRCLKVHGSQSCPDGNKECQYCHDQNPDDRCHHSSVCRHPVNRDCY